MSKNSSDIKLSSVIRIFNEDAVHDATLTELEFYLGEQKMLDTTEIVLAVTHEGVDRSYEIAKAHEKAFKHYQALDLGDRLGKGRTVAKGMLAAKGEYRLFTDADLATPAHHIPDMLELLEANNEVVIGVRNIRLMHETFIRRMSSMLSNAAIQFLAAPGIKDTQCGFKGFSAAAAERIFSQQRVFGWGFDFEVIAMARKFRYRLGIMKIDDWSDPKGDTGLVGDSQAIAMMKTPAITGITARKKYLNTSPSIRTQACTVKSEVTSK